MHGILFALLRLSGIRVASRVLSEKNHHRRPEAVMNAEKRTALTALFEQATDVKLAILFGSLARGCERPDSDGDIAVAGSRPLDADRRIRLIDSLATTLGRPVDLIDLRKAGFFMLRQTLLRGEMIYCADRSLLAEMRKRMVFEREDFAPYHRRVLRERRRAWIGM